MRKWSLVLFSFFLLTLNVQSQEVNVLDANGMKQGVWVEYHENGAIKSKITYVDNVAQGEYETFRESGLLYGRGMHKNGELDGVFYSYDTLGNVLSITTWEYGKLVDKKIMNPDAKETGTIEVIDGKKYMWLFGELKEVLE
jgi:uncharacterized protein YuzE